MRRHERDGLAVRRPARLVFSALRSRQSPDLSVGDAESKEIRIVETIRLRLAVGDEQDLAAVRRPVDRVLLVRARGQRARAPRRIHHEDVAAPVVVEARVPFHGVGLVEVARDHDGIAGGQLRLRAGVAETNAICLESGDQATARPSKVSGLFVPDVSASTRGPLPSAPATISASLSPAYAIHLPSGDQTGSDPLGVGTADLRGCAVRQRHHPELGARAPEAVVGLHGVGGARAVRRELDGRDRAHPVVVGALQAPGRGQGGRGGEGEDARESRPRVHSGASSERRSILSTRDAKGGEHDRARSPASFDLGAGPGPRLLRRCSRGRAVPGHVHQPARPAQGHPEGGARGDDARFRFRARRALRPLPRGEGGPTATHRRWWPLDASWTPRRTTRTRRRPRA